MISPSAGIFFQQQVAEAIGRCDPKTVVIILQNGEDGIVSKPVFPVEFPESYFLPDRNS